MQEHIKTIRKYSDEDLERATIALVKRERRLSIFIIQHLTEVHARRLWAKRSYMSLKEYCIKVLGDSETHARRRVAALNVILDVPEVEEKIIKGDLNLTTVGQLQAFVIREEKLKKRVITPAEKKELIEKIERKTEWQVDIEFAKISPHSVPADRERVLTEDQVQIQFTGDQALLQKLNLLRDELANSVSMNATYCELLHKVCDLALDKVAQGKRTAKRQSKGRSTSKGKDSFEGKGTSKTGTAIGGMPPESRDSQASEISPHRQSHSPNDRFQKAVQSEFVFSSRGGAEPDSAEFAPQDLWQEMRAKVEIGALSDSGSADPNYANPGSASSGEVAGRLDGASRIGRHRRRSISIHTKRAVAARDGHRCTFIDSISQRRCECRRGLEIDHIIPFSHGGSNDIENLRMLCRSHNQFEAIRTFGRGKMRSFIGSI